MQLAHPTSRACSGSVLAVLAAFLLSPLHHSLGQDSQPNQLDRGVKVNPSAASSVALPAIRHDYALLFATNEYESWPPLINPVPDAQAIAKELTDNYAFQTETVENPTRERIFRKLREYSQKPFGDADQLFIFFAGHGLYDDVFKQGYIVAKDSKMDDETRGSYASYDDLRTIVNAMKAKHIFLVMDACYSGTFDHRIGDATSRGTENYANFSLADLMANKFALPTRKFLTSGGKNYVPDGEPNHHSPFAAHLLETLRTYGGDQGYLTFAAILSGVEKTNPEPHWGEFGNNEAGSEFLFISKRLQAKKPDTGSTTSTANRSDSAANASIPEVQSANARPVIAIIGFKNLLGKSEDAWLSAALPEYLTTEIGGHERVRVISTDLVASAKTELGLADSSGLSPEVLTKLHERLGADYFVSGSYSHLGAKLRIDFRMQSGANRDIASGFAESESDGDLTNLVKRPAAVFDEKLVAASSAAPATAITASSLPTRADAARLFAEGLSRLRAYDLLKARDLLERAVASEPKSADAHSLLSRAWAELGYDAKARQEAANATELASNLSPENKLLIEGNYRALNSEWARAAEIYRSLWTLHPDEPEYPLQLIDTQISAGKPQDAFAIIEKLRASSARVAADPRFDLAEAVAAMHTADAKRQLEASSRGAEAASKQGSRLLSAEILWQKCSALLTLGDPQKAEEACAGANQASDLSGGQKLKARSLSVLANVLEMEGKNSEALELREQALRIATEIGSRKDMIGALLNLARSQLQQGQDEEAKSNYEKGITIAREIGDDAQLSSLQASLGVAYQSGGSYRKARELYQSSLEAAQKVGDKKDAAIALSNLALVQFQLGDLAAAEKSVRQAIDFSEANQIADMRATSIGSLGDIFLAQGRTADAEKAYKQSIELFTQLQDQSNIAGAQLSLAFLYLEKGDPNEARKWGQQAAEEFAREKAVDMEANSRDCLAQALLALHNATAAQEEVEKAKTLAPQDRPIRLSLETTEARVMASLGKLAEARQELTEANNEALKLGLIGTQLEIRLAQVELTKSRDPEALSTLREDARKNGFLLLAKKTELLNRER